MFVDSNTGTQNFGLRSIAASKPMMFAIVISTLPLASLKLVSPGSPKRSWLTSCSVALRSKSEEALKNGPGMKLSPEEILTVFEYSSSNASTMAAKFGALPDRKSVV